MSFTTGASDPHGWAKFPRSAIAFERVKEEAMRNLAFQVIVKNLAKSGVCTAEGKLLKRWEVGQWVTA